MTGPDSIFMQIRRRSFEELLAESQASSYTLFLTGGAFPERFDFDEPAAPTLEAIGAHAKTGFVEPAQTLAALARVFENALSEPVPSGSGLVAAARTMNLGVEFMVDRVRGTESVYFEITKNYPAAWFFALGWKILYDEVVMSAAQALQNAIVAALETGPKKSELLFFQRAFANAVQKGMPWLAGDFRKLESVFNAELTERFYLLTRELPRLDDERGAIASMNEVQEALEFTSAF